MDSRDLEFDLTRHAELEGKRWFCESESINRRVDFLRQAGLCPSAGRGTTGIFTKAAEIRGLEQMCIDFYEDPAFTHRFLRLVTEKLMERIKAWHRLVCGEELKLPASGGFGICDDSLQIISAALYERCVLPYHELLYSTMTRPFAMWRYATKPAESMA